MTNRNMVRGPAAEAPKPNTDPLPPMPAPEGSAAPTTTQEPPDSPQPNASGHRAPPDAGRPGLATDRA